MGRGVWRGGQREDGRVGSGKVERRAGVVGGGGG